MKGYKAFRKGLICRDKVYKENTVFEEDNAEICKSGMHFCKNPLDVLDYYPLIDGEGNITEFAEVEALDNTEIDNNEKFCTKKLKIGSKLSLSQFIKASFDFASRNIKSQVEASDGETLVGGNNTKLIGGYDTKLVGGTCAKLIGGNDAKIVGMCGATLVGGNCATLVGDGGATLVGGIWAELAGGTCAKLIGGKGAKAVGGKYAKLIGDNRTTLAGGDSAILVGDCDSTLMGGNNAIIVGDNGSIAKGKKGSIIVLVERDSDLNIVNFKAAQVDGEKIKEDTPYKLKNGELVEVAR